MFRGLRRKVAELSRNDCPRFKARGVNGSFSHAVCDAVAMLNNLFCTLSILPAKLQFEEFFEMPPCLSFPYTLPFSCQIGLNLHRIKSRCSDGKSPPPNHRERNSARE